MTLEQDRLNLALAERHAIVATRVEQLAENQLTLATTQREHGAEINSLKTNMANIVVELKNVRFAVYALAGATLAGPAVAGEAAKVVKTLIFRLIGM